MADPSDDLVLQSVALPPSPTPWPTIDPFLFCVHHLDRYPTANGRFGPDAPLSGRQMGQDFAGVDGWNMYHGLAVPGFPQHPHRGFETVTFARQGYIDHSDSLGAAARFGRGDVQWLTAGNGIVHSEMFPLFDEANPNPVELFQIWLNLPAEDKTADAHFAMLWDRDIPRHVVTDDEGNAAEVTVIAGELAGLVPPPPPPHSWAARSDTDVAIWHLRLDPSSQLVLPPVAAGTVRTLYFFEGSSLRIGERPIDPSSAIVVQPDVELPVSTATGAEVLVMQGRPIGEPVAQYGPFVLNDEAGIEQAFADYRETGFGGWPWDDDGPVHGVDRGRFARHADGRVEEIEPASAG
jgi:redox-sensitive bicupin YhaK (pirin superfamily)